MSRAHLFIALTALAPVGCGPAPEEDAQPVGQSHEAIASVMGGVEWSIDAPWRMEPTLHTSPLGEIAGTDQPPAALESPAPSSSSTSDGAATGAATTTRTLATRWGRWWAPTYGAIPITVTFHDASEQRDPSIAMALGQFCGVIINKLPMECGSSAYETYPVAAFHEIESHAKWPYSSDVPAFDRIRKLWKGEPYTDVLNIGESAEWNATLLYTPGDVAPGSDLLLQVTAVVSAVDQCPSWLDQSADTWNPTLRTFKNVLKVHYGEAPLP